LDRVWRQREGELKLFVEAASIGRKSNLREPEQQQRPRWREESQRFASQQLQM
jgi:hypothetical protein